MRENGWLLVLRIRSVTRKCLQFCVCACWYCLLSELVLFGAEKTDHSVDSELLPILSLRKHGYSIEHWGVEEGLPELAVTSITQTQDGSLWCATLAGLVRFDGERFRVIYPSDFDALKEFQFFRVLGDSVGNLWIVDLDGRLAVYQKGSVRRISELDGLFGGQAGKITKGKDGSIWIQGQRDHCFYRYWQEDCTFERVKYKHTPSTIVDRFVADVEGLTWAIIEDPNSRRLVSISSAEQRGQTIVRSDGSGQKFGRFFQLNDGSLAATSRDGVYSLRDSGWRLSHRFYSSLQESSPLDGVHDRNGNYWIGTWAGGLILSLADGTTGRIRLPKERQIPFVRSLIEDSYGNIWVGTDDGLYRIRLSLVRSPFNDDGVSRNILSIAEDSEERIWVAHDCALGFFSDDQEGFVDRRFDPRKVQPWCVFPAAEGGVWIACRSEELVEGRTGIVTEVWRATPRSFRRVFRVAEVVGDGYVFDIHETHDGRLWIGTDQGVYRQTETGFLLDSIDDLAKGNEVRSLSADNLGRLHAAVYGVGLYRWEGDSWLRLTQGDERGSDQIQAVVFDRVNNLWAATSNMGLACFKDGKWLSSASSGLRLPRDIRTLAADDTGGLWLSTVRGVLHVSGPDIKNWMLSPERELGFIRLDRDDGLDSGQCIRNESGIYKDSRGRIWVGTSHGLSVVDPNEFRRALEVPNPRTLHIEAVLLDGEVTWVPESECSDRQTPFKLVLPGRGRIEFRFAAVDLSSASKRRVRFQLEGFEDNWGDAGNRRSVSYSNLPPGHYKFRVAVTDRKGRWNNQDEVLTLVVEPIWRQTWWFRGICFAVLLAVVRYSFAVRLRYLRQERAVQQVFLRRLIDLQEKERKRIAKDLHDSLGQDLLVIQGNAALALKSLEHPEELKLRLQLLEGVCGEAIQEVRQITRGLRPMQLDHLGLSKAIKSMLRRVHEASGLAINHHIDSLDELLPPEFEISFYRVVQESLNNIQKHSGATRVKLTIRVHRGIAIHGSIQDNGCGFDPRRTFAISQACGGMGLHVIRERIQSMGGKVSFSSKAGAGVRLSFYVPLSIPVSPQGNERNH